MITNKQEISENIRKLKKYLIWGDFIVIAANIQARYGKTFSRSSIASCLNPASNYFNPLIYSEALKLSLQRQEECDQLNELERQLKD